MFTGTKFLIFLNMPCFFLSLSFNNLCIYGMADLLYLSVHVSFIKNFSWNLFDILCNFSFFFCIRLCFMRLKRDTRERKNSLLASKGVIFAKSHSCTCPVTCLLMTNDTSSAARPHSELFLCNTSKNFHQMRASTGHCTLHLSLGHSCQPPLF